MVWKQFNRGYQPLALLGEVPPLNSYSSHLPSGNPHRLLWMWANIQMTGGTRHSPWRTPRRTRINCNWLSGNHCSLPRFNCSWPSGNPNRLPWFRANPLFIMTACANVLVEHSEEAAWQSSPPSLTCCQYASTSAAPSFIARALTELSEKPAWQSSPPLSHTLPVCIYLRCSLPPCMCFFIHRSVQQWNILHRSVQTCVNVSNGPKNRASYSQVKWIHRHTAPRGPSDHAAAVRREEVWLRTAALRPCSQNESEGSQPSCPPRRGWAGWSSRSLETWREPPVIPTWQVIDSKLPPC